jgi:hypothetical protein
MKVLIAEDAEVAEARREKQKRTSLRGAETNAI